VRRLALDPGVRFYRDGLVCVGGSPSRVVRFSERARCHLESLRRCGASGAALGGADGAVLARLLVERGLAHPVVLGEERASDLEVVVPFFGHPEMLDGCLEALSGKRVIVVDDGCPDHEAIRATALRHGARVVCHRENRGPGAARNSGARAARSALVAFVDADCRPRPGALELMTAHFADEKVGAVAARVLSAERDTVLGRYEAAHGPLDMGGSPGLARRRGRIGYVPSAALVVRRDLLGRIGFDESLRLGEDVDFVWRVDEAGSLVLYEPRAVAEHEPTTTWTSFTRRRFLYGTSAAGLSRRHPRELVPARLSAWNLGPLGLVALGQAPAAATLAGANCALLCLRLRSAGVPPAAACGLYARGLASDARNAGELARREWWPLGLASLLLARRSRAARLAAVLLLAQLGRGWQPGHRIGPVRYAAIRLLEGVSYGMGVQAGCVRQQTIEPLRPVIGFRGRGWPRRRSVRRAGVDGSRARRGR
jgi:mycofactocin system glycosyltransferase